MSREDHLDQVGKLSDADIRLLEPLIYGEKTLSTCMSETEKRRIQSLVDRGYVRLVLVLCGPMSSKTGEVVASLTEAGLAVISGAVEK